ncbi:unnamed protein product [Nezara viridula]|uniref:F-box domain-containing protein n=1 Tax=Nezara viridula TaxID=85310 RepID=A0A9P0EDP7_NEZVI|nr:unnamed protein product [Nezara viridula]
MLGVLGRRLLLLSNASSFDVLNSNFENLFNGYSDIIFLNQTALMRMGPQFTNGRKFLPFRNASQFFSYDKLPNFGGVTLKAAYVNCSPLVLIKENKVVGLEIFLINELGKAMNITWNLTVFKGNPWGKYKNDTWEGGIIGSIMQHQYDIGLCGFWIKQKQLKFVDATLDYSQMIIVYVLPRRFYGKRWKSIYTPFSYQLWICIACTMLVSILALHVLSKLIGKGRKFHDWIFLVIGRFLGCSTLPSSGPAMFRVAVLFVSVAALIVCSIYSSAVVSHLTSPPRLFQPKTVEDLYKMKYSWTTAFPVRDLNNLLRLTNKWQKTFNTRFRYPVNLKSVFRSNKYAVLCQLVEKFPLSVNAESVFLENTYILPELVNVYHIGFPLPKGSPLVIHASRVIDRLKSSGIIDKAVNDISRLYGGVDIILNSKEPRPLTITSLQNSLYLRSRMDILGELPVEIAQNILGLLSPDDLLSCSAVSRIWRRLVDCLVLWRKLCSRRENTEPLWALNKWALNYQLRNQIPISWEKKESMDYRLSPEDSQITVLACDGKRLAVGHANGVVSILDVYRVPYLVTSLSCLLKGYRVLGLSIAGRHLVLFQSMLLQIYISDKDSYSLVDAKSFEMGFVYIEVLQRYGDTLDNFVSWYSSEIESDRISKELLATTVIYHLSEPLIYVGVREYQMIYVWSLIDGLTSPGVIKVWEKETGKEVASRSTGYISFKTVSSLYDLIIFSERTTVFVWEPKNDIIIRTFSLEDVVIFFHPCPFRFILVFTHGSCWLCDWLQGCKLYRLHPQYIKSGDYRGLVYSDDTMLLMKADFNLLDMTAFC